MRKLLLAWLLPLLALLAACDRVATGELQPGFSTVADLKSKMGEPFQVRRQGDGEIWIYPLGPEGVKTYFMYIDASGKLARIDQVLNEANFARIQPGMTREEVENLIGPHGREQRFAMSPTEVTFKYKFNRQNNDIFFDVVYDTSTGRVKATGFDERSLSPDSSR